MASSSSNLAKTNRHIQRRHRHSQRRFDIFNEELATFNEGQAFVEHGDLFVEFGQKNTPLSTKKSPYSTKSRPASTIAISSLNLAKKHWKEFIVNEGSRFNRDKKRVQRSACRGPGLQALGFRVWGSSSYRPTPPPSPLPPRQSFGDRSGLSTGRSKG